MNNKIIYIIIGLLAIMLSFGLLSCNGKTSSEGDSKTKKNFESYLDDGGILIDVRTPKEYKDGHVPGAINRPVEDINSWKDSIEKEQAIYLYCRSGNRSGQAAKTLKNNGYSKVYDLGGIGEYDGTLEK